MNGDELILKRILADLTEYRTRDIQDYLNQPKFQTRSATQGWLKTIDMFKGVSRGSVIWEERKDKVWFCFTLAVSDHGDLVIGFMGYGLRDFRRGRLPRSVLIARISHHAALRIIQRSRGIDGTRIDWAKIPAEHWTRTFADQLVPLINAYIPSMHEGTFQTDAGVFVVKDDTVVTLLDKTMKFENIGEMK